MSITDHSVEMGQIVQLCVVMLLSGQTDCSYEYIYLTEEEFDNYFMYKQPEKYKIYQEKNEREGTITRSNGTTYYDENLIVFRGVPEDRTFAHEVRHALCDLYVEKYNGVHSHCTGHFRTTYGMIH